MRFKTIIFFILLSYVAYSQKQNSSIGFIENKGQIIDQKGKQNKEVLFLLNTPGLNIQIKKNGFSYDLYENKKIKINQKKFLESTKCLIDSEENANFKTKRNFHRIDFDLVGSNSNVEIMHSEKSSDYDNYYNIPNRPNGITNVHKFKKITYKNIYNHIDLDFFIPKDTTKAVEYNFIVRPGGKISDIQLEIKGGKTELINNKIRVSTRFGKMEETIPMSWIEEGNIKKQVSIHYKKIDNNVYGFEGDLNSSHKTIVIDPVPIRLWGTYYGGEGMEIPNDIITDNNKNLYISGSTDSQSNIATFGTHQNNLIGQRNLFIAKLDAYSNRVWGTYILAEAGLNNSQSCNLAVDSNYNIYITGDENNNSFIGTPGTFQELKNNFFDGFLVKLNSTGIKQWGTYFGGNRNEFIHSICVDSNDNIFVVGQTFSTDFNTLASSFQNSMNGSSDGFIIKFNPSGNRVWNTYYGGTGFDGFTGINYSNDGYIYITGLQRSISNIATPGSFQPTTTSNSGGMIVKFDLNGNRIWGSYVADNSFIHKTVLKNNSLCFLGLTNNQNIGTTGSLFETFQIPPTESTLNSGTNGYLLNFNVQTQQIKWASYFIDNLGGLGIDNNEDVYFSGKTTINNNITTPDGFMPTKNGMYSKNYLIKLNSIGQRIWGTYSGGDLSEQSGYCTIDNNNDIYIYGITYSSNGISTPGAHQEYLASNSSLYIFKFKDCLSNTTATSNSPTCIGSNLQLSASGGTNYNWTGPNGFTSTQQNPLINNVNSTYSGQYSCSITGTGGCDNTVTIDVVVGDSEAPIPNISNLPTITGDCNTVISTIPTAHDNCVGTVNATTTNPISFSIPGNYTVTWNYSDGNGNSSSQTQNVTITSLSIPILNSNQQFCIQQNATLSNIVIIGQNIKWYDSQTGGNLLSTTTLLQNNLAYYASQTINNCESERVPVLINIYNTLPPTANSIQSFCSTENATLNSIVVNGSGINWYSHPTSNTPLPSNTVLLNNTTYYATQTINNCESISRTSVTINLINTLNADNYFAYFCDDQDNGHEKIDLTNYNPNILSNQTGCTFSYYSSRNGAENQIPNQRINNFENYQLTIGTSIIYVRIDNINSCNQIVELSLTLYKKPVINLPEVLPICQGNSIQITPGNFDTYLWSTGEITPSITVSNPGDYNATVTENHLGINCTTNKNFKIVNSNVATIHNVDIRDWTTNNNSISVIVTNNSIGDYEYSIDNILFQTSNTFNNLTPGEYTVYVRDKNGCGTIYQKVYIISYPKFFTPNNDGNNDYWKIDFAVNEPDIIINIYNRFGKLLKQFNNDSQGWDGTYLGNPLPSDDYWFSLVRANGVEYKGHFSLKR